MDGAAVDDGVERAGRWPEQVRGERTVGMLEPSLTTGCGTNVIDGTLIVSPPPVPAHSRRGR